MSLVWKQGYKYRHRNFLDVDMFITQIQYKSDKKIRCRVLWMNQRTNLIYCRDTVIMEAIHYERWKEV